MHRRSALETLMLSSGLWLLGESLFPCSGGSPPLLACERNPPKSDRRGVVHVVVFSNFEGQPLDAASAIRWFEACTQAHPAIRWTHMYNPRYLVIQSPELKAAEAVLSPYLLKLQAAQSAEIGLHLHMYYDMVQAMGVAARAYPFAGDNAADCSSRRSVDQDRSGGYDVLLTGYALDEQAQLLDAAIEAYQRRGFRPPTSFCAGYSATDPQTQALLVRKGIEVSFAAQAISPQLYGSCWEKLLAWSSHITPLTIPYRVSRDSILPPPHAGGEYLDLVEVPLNLGVDAHELYLDQQRVSRLDMFDRHYTWTHQTNQETAVAIGVHAEVIAAEAWGQGHVSRVLDEFLSHVARRAQAAEVDVRFDVASQVASRFRSNRNLGSVISETR